MKRTDTIIQQLKAYLLQPGSGEPPEAISTLMKKYPGLSRLVGEMQHPETRKTSLRAYETFLREIAEAESEERMLERIRHSVYETRAQSPARRTGLLRGLGAYGVAAALLILGTLGFWVLQNQKSQGVAPETLVEGKIEPGSNQAVLSFSDGTKLALSQAHGKIVVGQKIAYGDGSPVGSAGLLRYIPSLTLTTPNGGQYQVELPDGTQVWLNAASSLYYPSKFDSIHRSVELRGEAYFEVKPDASRPFIVNTPYERIRVLGTHFNVNAYAEESESRVALIEGKVQVRVPGNTSRILKPGQQSIVRGEQIQIQDAHAGDVLAWKNGAFSFNDEPMDKVMRKLARWYDIEFELDPELKDQSVWGSVSRYERIEKVLDILKRTQQNIQIEIEGRRVVIRKN